MDRVVEDNIFMIKVPFRNQNFTTGVWRGTLELH